MLCFSIYAPPKSQQSAGNNRSYRESSDNPTLIERGYCDTRVVFLFSTPDYISDPNIDRSIAELKSKMFQFRELYLNGEIVEFSDLFSKQKRVLNYASELWNKYIEYSIKRTRGLLSTIRLRAKIENEWNNNPDPDSLKKLIDKYRQFSVTDSTDSKTILLNIISNFQKHCQEIISIWNERENKYRQLSGQKFDSIPEIDNKSLSIIYELLNKAKLFYKKAVSIKGLQENSVSIEECDIALADLDKLMTAQNEYTDRFNAEKYKWDNFAKEIHREIREIDDVCRRMNSRASLLSEMHM